MPTPGSNVLRSGLALLGLVSIIAPSGQAWACATCGLNSTFTPATLVISFGFFLLPIALVALIGWRLYKDSNDRGAP